MLTNMMPAFARAASGQVSDQYLQGLMQSLGNCGQPLEHRGPASVRPGLPPTSQRGAWTNMPWNPNDFADIAPQLSSPAMGINLQFGPNGSFPALSYTPFNFSAYQNSAQYGYGFPIFGGGMGGAGGGGFINFAPFLSNRLIVNGDFPINITLPPYGPPFTPIGPVIGPAPGFPTPPPGLRPGLPPDNGPAQEPEPPNPPAPPGAVFPPIVIVQPPGSVPPPQPGGFPPGRGGGSGPSINVGPVGIGGLGIDMSKFVTNIVVKNNPKVLDFEFPVYKYTFDAEACALIEEEILERRESIYNEPVVQPYTESESFGLK